MIASVFNSIADALTGLGNYGLLVANGLRWSFRRPFRIRLLMQQLEFIGNRSLSIIILTGFFTGAVFALQSLFAFRLFNAESLVGSTVALSLTRELAPVLTSLMVTGRCGSAMAAEIGTMRVTEQIDALTSMAVNPVQYLAVPRVIATIIMLPVLTMVFNMVGLLGSYIVATYLEHVDPGIMMENVRWYVDPLDLYIGLWKAAVFGYLISTIGTYKGFTASGGARGVGKATTQAVVAASVTILVSDYFLTQLFYALFENPLWID